MNESLQHINALVAANRIDEAIELCTRLIEEAGGIDSIEAHDALIQRGKLLWRKGVRGAAVTDYNHALKLRPDGPAASLLNFSNDILDFYNPDMLNP